jgi:hypothetical protein
MKKHLPAFIIILVIVGAISFYMGTKTSANNSADSPQKAMWNQPGNANFRRPGNANTQGNFINGEILSKDNKSVTVKLRDGGSKIVFFSSATQIAKSVAGTPDDLAVGVNLMITGTDNPDGSVTAQMIQLRPAEAAGKKDSGENPAA